MLSSFAETILGEIRAVVREELCHALAVQATNGSDSSQKLRDATSGRVHQRGCASPEQFHGHSAKPRFVGNDSGYSRRETRTDPNEECEHGRIPRHSGKARLRINWSQLILLFLWQSAIPSKIRFLNVLTLSYVA